MLAHFFGEAFLWGGQKALQRKYGFHGYNGYEYVLPMRESAKENKNLKFCVLKENIKKNLEQLMKVEILFRQNQVLWDN